VDAQRCIFRRSPSADKGKNVLCCGPSTVSVYAFDAVHLTARLPLSLEDFHARQRRNHQRQRGCGKSPEIGITATPVIDRPAMLLRLAMSKNPAGTYFQRIHALDLTTGQELFGGP